MFFLSKIFWVFAAPGNILLLIIGVGMVTLSRSAGRRGLGFVAIGVTGLAATALLPTGAWLMLPLENRIPPPTELPDQLTGLVVLGGGVDETASAARRHPTVNDAADRLVSAAALARRYPDARIVVAGGAPHILSGVTTESAAMKAFLIEEGITASRIIEETRSRNTRENAVFAFQEVNPKPGETWLLVTSAFHMPRAIGCFRRAGWSIIPYPVDFKTTGRFSVETQIVLGWQLYLTTLAVKEWIGLVAYRALGYTDALLPD
jgi:uncharacterized SAM-binding protein YcdF (DUF218 family)